MKATLTWRGDMSFLAQSETGHELILDSSADFGGNNQGPRPMELILLGLGGCTSIDVMNILKKTRQQVSDVTCSIEAARADTIPAVFTKIHIHFVVTGIDIKENQVRKAIELSAEKYCSASRMLEAGGVVITHDFEIVQNNY